nr:NAD(P)/FAD-dependent oxidoreductase [Thermoanaerobacter thermocopriae]
MGKEVSIFERNNILGKKLLVTGNGRCNITNLLTKKNFLRIFQEIVNFYIALLASFQIRI